MNTVDTLQDAHIDGIRAALDGEPRSACPWSPSTPEGREWCRGWTEQTMTDRDLSGQALADTARMKAEANAYAANLPEYRPDPTAILDEPEWSVRLLDAYGNIAAAAERVVVSFSGLNETFIRWQVTSIDKEAWLPASIWDEAGPQGITTSATSPTLNRRRHGRMASCPRHGDTKGGLCRRCARGR